MEYCRVQQWSTTEVLYNTYDINTFYNNFILRSAPLGTDPKRSKILSEPLHSTSTRHLLMLVMTVTKQIPDLIHFLDFKFNHKRYGRTDKIQQVHKKKKWF